MSWPFVLKEANVFYKDHHSDKEYHITLEEVAPFAYKVQAKFGPRNGTLTHVDLTRGVASSYVSAFAIYSKKLNEKLAKGYDYAMPKNAELIKRLKRETNMMFTSRTWEKLAEVVATLIEEAA